MKKNQKYNEFTKLMDGILSVPHSQIKEKLDAEKKGKKRKKSKTSSASGHV